MGTKMQVLGGKIKFLSYKLSMQFGLVAQWLEQQTHNLEVLGSSPSWSTKDDSVNL